MPNYHRARVEGGTYFFTVNTFRRQPFLTDVDVRAALRAGIATVRAEHPFVIEAWVLLADYMHALWTLPPDDRDFSTRWQLIKRTVTQRCGARLHRPEWLTARRAQRHQSTLWQHRFWEHVIRDETDFVRHVDYIHRNPVKHGYVKRVEDWPYSSFHRYVTQEQRKRRQILNCASKRGRVRTTHRRAMAIMSPAKMIRCSHEHDDF